MDISKHLSVIIEKNNLVNNNLIRPIKKSENKKFKLNIKKGDKHA